MSPELEAEAAAALGAQAEKPAPAEGGQDALEAAVGALIGIEKHMFALVYLLKTSRPAETGITYVEDVFNAIYDDSDPFVEVQEILQKAKNADAANPA